MNFRISVNVTGEPKAVLEAEGKELGFGSVKNRRVGEIRNMPEGSNFWKAAGIWLKADPPPHVHILDADGSFLPWDTPPECVTEGNRLRINLPGLSRDTPHPLEAVADYWGNFPHLQILCYNHDDPQGEPKVAVRYDAMGRVEEVLVDPSVLVVTEAMTSAWQETRDGVRIR